MILLFLAAVVVALTATAGAGTTAAFCLTSGYAMYASTERPSCCTFVSLFCACRWPALVCRIRPGRSLANLPTTGRNIGTPVMKTRLGS